MFMMIKLISENGEVEEDVKVPAKYEVCPGCEGCGTDRGRSVECEGGGFTASEWAEACDDDPGCDGEPGFAEKYFGGAYDLPCEVCQGKRVVQVIDRDYADPEILARYDEAAREEAEYQAMRQAEMRMGA